MIEWIFTLLVVYLLYKLVFDFILPVSKATSQVRTKIKEMQQTDNQSRPNPTAKPQNTTSAKEGDYIDFEEIK